jgi:hypothetical protein
MFRIMAHAAWPGVSELRVGTDRKLMDVHCVTAA